MDLSAGSRPLYAEIIAAIEKVITNSDFIGGEEVAAFENEFAAFAGRKHAVACGNGTDALIIALKALGIGPGDTVVTVPNTFIATAEAVTAVGAGVAFVDIEEEYYTIDPEKLRRLLEANKDKRIKAVIPVHLYGQMADMEKIFRIAKEYKLKVIEDAAQAHGALLNGKSSGAFSDAATYSFYPGKNLGAFGDAGAVVTDNADLSARIKKLSNHGRVKKYEHEFEGYNSRLDAIQAAVLRIKLRHLKKGNESRINKAERYTKLLSEDKSIICPQVRNGAKHVFHLYVVQVSNRDEVRLSLKEKVITTGIHYPLPLHLQPAYKYLGYHQGSFPIAEEAAKKILSLPLWPEMSLQAIEYVCSTLLRLRGD